MTTFILSDTPTRALVAHVIQMASEIAGTKGGYVGRTAMQKILYFLQRSGVPLPYQFELYNYGPFCSDIYTDVEYLMADGAVMDKSDKPRYSNYGPTDKAAELVSLHAAEVSPYTERIKKVVEVLVPLKPNHMELIATLDYLYQQELAKNPDGPVKDAVVERFLQVKGEKHGNKSEVEQKYENLEKAGLFTP